MALSVLEIARFILSLNGGEDSEISNLKLQKLVYYAQGYNLAINDTPLFNEEVLAWRHGPVVEELYHHYKHHGSNPIPSEEIVYEIDLPQEQKDVIQEVLDVFDQFSAWKLRNMTHDESPWMNHEAKADVIPKEELKEYFKTRVA